MFVLLFCVARMVFAGPFDLGIYGAVNSWFRQDRGRATSITTFTQMAGLMAMPLIAQLTIVGSGWRAGLARYRCNRTNHRIYSGVGPRCEAA